MRFYHLCAVCGEQAQREEVGLVEVRRVGERGGKKAVYQACKIKKKKKIKMRKKGGERGGVSIMLLSDTCYRLHKCLSL
jgi:hypothetical protein